MVSIKSSLSSFNDNTTMMKHTSTPSTHTTTDNTNSIVVLDNGAYTCKIGLISQQQQQQQQHGQHGQHGQPLVISNCGVRRKRGKQWILGDQVDTLIDYSSVLYRRPLEKGFIVGKHLQEQLWSRLFGKSGVDIDPHSSRLMLTEAPLCPTAIQRMTDEIVFELFGFYSAYRTCGAALCHTALCIASESNTDHISQSHTDNYKYNNNTTDTSVCSLIVDAGFSFTHVVPVFKGRAITSAIRRIAVGGKLITNYLKESLSFRHWNVMDETHLVNEIKEQLCFVPLDFMKTLSESKRVRRMKSLRTHRINTNDNDIMARYVLPCGENAGYVLQKGKQASSDEQILSMNNERICAPELLFNPGDIGICHAGVCEAIIQSIEACPPELHATLYANIVLVGGTTRMCGYKQRIEHDVRTMAPTPMLVRTRSTAEPELDIWRHAAIFATQEHFDSFSVTKEEYFEFGSSICHRKLVV